MSDATENGFDLVVGLDIGDRESQFAVLNRHRKFVGEGSVPTTKDGVRKQFTTPKPLKIIIETGTHSPWIARLLRDLQHEVIIADSRRLPLITKSKKKSDRVDAKMLARLGMLDDELLNPTHLRSEQTLLDRALMTARDALVRSRTLLLTTVRGVLKPFGVRIPDCSAEAFVDRALASLPKELRTVVWRMLRTIEQLNVAIAKQDRKLKRVSDKRYAATQKLQQISGVGRITSLAYVLAIEDPSRFHRSRDVAAYVGLTPRLHESGMDKQQTRITKAGDGVVRRLLVSSAHYVLGRHGPDCDLKRFGLKLCERGGKNAKKRAIVAIARKLAVLLHRLWISDEPYDPFRKASQLEKAKETADTIGSRASSPIASTEARAC